MCDKCEWSDTLTEIETALSIQGTPDSQRKFLTSVSEGVREHEHITEAQTRKVNEIINEIYA